MSDEREFQDLIRRVRAGDADAAAELVRGYEPAIRRMVRMGMRDSRLRRMFDSIDICQSVLGSLFVRVAMGQYQLDTPQNLVALLGTMASRRVAAQARKKQVVRRDLSHDAAGRMEQLASKDSTPGSRLARADLLKQVRDRLSAQEQSLADERAQGKGWAEIAAARGVQPDAARKQLARAMNRVAQILRLDELAEG
jgi:RNA polymerase sigma factor (sigma-70 family)